MELTFPETLPTICNMCNLPIANTPGNKWNVKDYQLEYEGRLYHFSSEADRWCFQIDPERYKNHMNLVDRFLNGEIQPANLAGALKYMGLEPDVIGDDAHDYGWARAYQKKTNAA
jgi:toluene monooxygenase system protein A